MCRAVVGSPREVSGHVSNMHLVPGLQVFFHHRHSPSALPHHYYTLHNQELHRPIWWYHTKSFENNNNSWIDAGFESKQEYRGLFCPPGWLNINKKMPSSIILREDISEFSVQAGSHLSLQKLPLTGSPRCLSYLVGGSFSNIDTFVEYAVKTLGAKITQLWETGNIPRSYFPQAQLVQAWTPKRHRVPAGGAHRQDPHYPWCRWSSLSSLNIRQAGVHPE